MNYRGIARGALHANNSAPPPLSPPRPRPLAYFTPTPLLWGLGPLGRLSGEVTRQLEGEEEVDVGPRRDGAAPGLARVPAPGLRTALTAAPAPALHHDAPATGGAGCSGVILVKKEEAEEIMGQQRDRVALALALAHGPVRVESHTTVDS